MIGEGLALSDIVILTSKTVETSWINLDKSYAGQTLSTNQEPGKILFTTIRKFKGLEAEAILIVDAQMSALTNPENRRLLYTGTSRAKNLLSRRMIIAVITFRLRAPWVHSLKEKRMIVKSLIAKLQNRYHVSAAEIDEQDIHQVIVIGVAAIVAHNAMADSLMDDISLFVEENTEAEIIDEEREIRYTIEEHKQVYFPDPPPSA